jgi:DNA (cytosine-5)-methyltransferase 1
MVVQPYEVGNCLTARMHKGINSTLDEGQTPVISIHPHCIGRAPEAGPQGKEYLLDGSAYCMDSRGQPQAIAQPIGWSEELTASIDLAGTIQRGGDGGRHDGVMQTNMAVRRLTPVECERLQGFPDNYTNIKDKCPDGPRYKALGNSWAVPVVRWIGERIAKAA